MELNADVVSQLIKALRFIEKSCDVLMERYLKALCPCMIYLQESDPPLALRHLLCLVLFETSSAWDPTEHLQHLSMNFHLKINDSCYSIQDCLHRSKLRFLSHYLVTMN